MGGCRGGEGGSSHVPAALASAPYPSKFLRNENGTGTVPLLLAGALGDTVLSTHNRLDGHPCNLPAKSQIGVLWGVADNYTGIVHGKQRRIPPDSHCLTHIS